MKRILYIPVLAAMLFAGCKKTIDLYPQSNLNTGTFYSNVTEIRAGLTGCYNGLRAPLETEWMMTELRSDNAKQGVPGSSSASNRELNELDMFYLNSLHPRVYDYWLASYNNIRNVNIILQKLGVSYDPATGVTSFQTIDVPVSDADRKQLAGEALFIRAHHYFNLVRLFGGVFLVHTTITADVAKTMNRASAEDIYKLVQADLKTATESMNTLRYNQLPATELGKVTGWAAKTLLAKVYLTLNKKADAITLLNDVRTNSGHALVTAPGSAGSAYANIFSAGNEVNSEIIFTIRYKAGGLGLGAPFANRFGPLNTLATIVPGDGQGLNYPTADLDSSIRTNDARKNIDVARLVSGASTKSYTRKYFPNPNPTSNPQSMTSNDSESDWPVLRYADVLLMLAEAQGNSQASIDLINTVRTRAGATPINNAGITSVKLFEDTLSAERRIEFAFENQRWFDLLRFNTTMTTVTAEGTMKEHFAREYPVHYVEYPLPRLTLPELQNQVTRERLLLPIPQREIDTNTSLRITQNPGY
ncbi:RagB/SusD family nutrient uptake outer membrane protein [Segetibacter sp. 3557_3]|uniref:RagB/SusD family nutrient uptake outer membrane protein n=1 Tax=Segetibacter sp. 3557_3 TaxID=2547429 RepID=UPI001058E369|nr:RagB/SusD family nutrient uptake outer membrane protein [Segetibacter sp. 3557_3]TDH28631.1 RagB/SusD family nutrient uptake outer membrane protein [Segetibacter sp. 3557_3]